MNTVMNDFRKVADKIRNDKTKVGNRMKSVKNDKQEQIKIYEELKQKVLALSIVDQHPLSKKTSPKNNISKMLGEIVFQLDKLISFRQNELEKVTSLEKKLDAFVANTFQYIRPLQETSPLFNLSEKEAENKLVNSLFSLNTINSDCNVDTLYKRRKLLR